MFCGDLYQQNSGSSDKFYSLQTKSCDLQGSVCVYNREREREREPETCPATAVHITAVDKLKEKIIYQVEPGNNVRKD